MRRSRARKAAKKAEDTTAFRRLARVGFAVNGLLHILIGGIALSIVWRVGLRTGDAEAGPNADQTGALQALADTPGGILVIWVIAVALAALGLYQIALAIRAPHTDTVGIVAHRVREYSKAAAYLVVSATTFVFAFGGDADAAESGQRATAALLATPGGVVLLVAAGIGVVIAGVVFVVMGATRSFRKTLDVPTGRVGTAVTTLGVVGYISKGIALLLVGALIVIAAVTDDTKLSRGLDGALRHLAGLPSGIVVLALIGIGLIIYGIFLGARAVVAKM